MDENNVLYYDKVSYVNLVKIAYLSAVRFYCLCYDNLPDQQYINSTKFM